MRIAIIMMLLAVVSLAGAVAGYQIGYTDTEILYIQTTTIEHHVEYQVKYQVEYIEVPVYPSLREFASIRELRNWLKQDLTDTIPYEKRIQDCDDYAIELVKSASADGYQIGITMNRKHAMNFAIIGNYVLLVEPQTDEIIEWGTLD
jgi:hypothetical protein